MVFNFIFYVYEGWFDYGILYAFILGTLCVLVNVLLWPMTAIACFVGLMVAEGKYTVFTRLFYFLLEDNNFMGGGYNIVVSFLIFFFFLFILHGFSFHDD